MLVFLKNQFSLKDKTISVIVIIIILTIVSNSSSNGSSSSSKIGQAI
jgi:hypothetical protein